MYVCIQYIYGKKNIYIYIYIHIYDGYIPHMYPHLGAIAVTREYGSCDMYHLVTGFARRFSSHRSVEKRAGFSIGDGVESFCHEKKIIMVGFWAYFIIFHDDNDNNI